LGYDQLFKTVLERLLRDFMELFFPKPRPVSTPDPCFVEKEVFASVPDGTVREADIVG
jgi:hypothetical protein